MPPEEAWPGVGDPLLCLPHACLFPPLLLPLLSSPSCLLTSLPLPNGAAHPPREAPWDGADGGGSGCPIRHTAWPGLEKCLGRAWSLSPSFAPAGLWVSFPGLPACCLPASLSASALEPCSPAFLGEGLWSPPPGADHHCWAWQTLPSRQGSWTDMPYAALQGQSGKGPFALAGLCPPLLTAAFLSPSPTPGLGCSSFLSCGASLTGPSRG